MRRKSIRYRMTIGFALCVAIFMMAVCGGLVWFSIHSAIENADLVLSLAARRLTSELVRPRSASQWKQWIEDERENLGMGGIGLVVIKQDGREVNFSDLSASHRSLVTGVGWRTKTITAGNDEILIGIAWEKTEADIRSHVHALLTLSLLVIALSAFGAWIMVARVLSPIAELSHQASRASAGNLRVRLEEPTGDEEIVDLVATLNQLLARLTQTELLYSVASHELRTPLQALSGHLELALSRRRNEEDYRLFIEEAYAQTRRLMVLAQDLLLLYRLESSTPQPSQQGQLADVCRRMLALCKPMIEQAKLNVTMQLASPADFTAPPTHADVLVRNLIENAAKYANREGELSIDLAAKSGSLQLVVTNSCASSDGRADLLADMASSLSYQSGGTGLGLAICQAIASANDWNLSVTREDSAVRAALVLPERPESAVD